MDHKTKVEISKARNVLIASNHPAFNYPFVKEQSDIDDFAERPMIIGWDKYDYSVKRDEGDDMNLPSLTPLTLVSCTHNLEDVEAWFAAKYPRLPSEYHGVMARYSTNQLLTKKETKNAVKKMKKDPSRQEPVGLSIARGPVELNFD